MNKPAQLPAWLLAFLHQPQQQNEPVAEPPRPPPDLSSVGDPLQKWALSGFHAELVELAGVLPGAQAASLNKSAFKIGQLVGTGYLNQAEAEEGLTNVALGFINQAGKEPWSRTNARPHIMNGLNAGMKEPRRLPEVVEKPSLFLRKKPQKSIEPQRKKMRVQQPTSNTEYENIPAGKYQAVLVEFVDSGWQMDKFGKGMQPQVDVIFQVNYNLKDGRLAKARIPYMTLKWYASSKPGMSHSKWVQFLFDILGTNKGLAVYNAALNEGDFDEQMLVGKNAMLEIGPDVKNINGVEKTYDKILNVIEWLDQFGPAMIPQDYVSYTQNERYEKPLHSAWEDFPGDRMTGEVSSDYQAPAPSTPAPQTQAATPAPQAAPQPPAGLVAPTMSKPAPVAPPAPPAPPVPVPGGITPEQIKTIETECERVWGDEDWHKFAQEKMGVITTHTIESATGWIAWLKAQPAFDPFDGDN